MKIRSAPALLTVLLPLQLAATPADTYFAMAVTENSHNHAGANLLFLDFQELAAPNLDATQTVISPRVAPDAIRLDGDLTDWNRANLTRLRTRVMNNYPLSEFYDAVPVDLLIGSAWDEEYVYFVVDFEDANHDASINRNRWHYLNGRWQKQAHAKPNAGTPTSRAVNRSDTITGGESEDRVFFMFPIVDRQGNFRNGGLGCGGYCHANLVESETPSQGAMGEGVAAMHTTLPGDRADIWHWQATRSRPADTLKDAHLVYGEGSFNGRKADAGQSPDQDNDRKALGTGDQSTPAYVSRRDFEAGAYRTRRFRTETLAVDDLLEITASMQFAEGVSIPYSIRREATGSRSDVQAVAQYHQETHRWTVEFRRKLNTGDDSDHQFVPGVDATPPTREAVRPGDPANGRELYAKWCSGCHGDSGEGKVANGHWHYPRNQRASGPLISKAASIDRPKRMENLAWKSDGQGAAHTHHLMSFVPITQQQAEDVAAWLQQQLTPLGK